MKKADDNVDDEVIEIEDINWEDIDQESEVNENKPDIIISPEQKQTTEHPQIESNNGQEEQDEEDEYTSDSLLDNIEYLITNKVQEISESLIFEFQNIARILQETENVIEIPLNSIEERVSALEKDVKFLNNKLRANPLLPKFKRISKALKRNKPKKEKKRAKRTDSEPKNKYNELAELIKKDPKELDKLVKELEEQRQLKGESEPKTHIH